MDVNSDIDENYIMSLQNKSQIPIDRIENKIYEIRNQKVMLDFDLAGLYEVQTRVLNMSR